MRAKAYATSDEEITPPMVEKMAMIKEFLKYVA